MKRIGIVLIVVCAAATLSAESHPKVLWNTSHVLDQKVINVTGFMAPIPYEEGYFESQGFLVDLREGGLLDYELLKEYDVLVEWVPFKEFTEEERASVARFVENGGGLLLVGEYATTLYGGIAGTSDKPGFDSLSTMFGVVFVEDFVHGAFMEVADHPVTRGIETLFLANFGGLESNDPRFVSVARTKSNVIAIGTMNYGMGRIVFSTDAFCEERANDASLLLASNALRWISEKGGPHRHAHESMLRASLSFSDAIEKFCGGEYENAAILFHESAHFYNQQNKFYDTDVTEKLATIDSYIEKCSLASRAVQARNEGQTLFSFGKYEEARQAYLDAASLFEQAGVATSSEMHALAQKAMQARQEEEAKKAEEARKEEEQKATTPPPTVAPSQTPTRYYSAGAFIAFIIMLLVILFRKSERGEAPPAPAEKEAEGIEEKKEEIIPASSSEGEPIVPQVPDNKQLPTGEGVAETKSGEGEDEKKGIEEGKKEGEDDGEAG